MAYKVLYPLAIAPDTVVGGLDELVSQLPDAKQALGLMVSRCT